MLCIKGSGLNIYKTGHRIPGKIINIIFCAHVELVLEPPSNFTNIGAGIRTRVPEIQRIPYHFCQPHCFKPGFK